MVARRVKVGGGVNLEQQITLSLGLFARLSMATGQYEPFGFPEVERSLSGGVVVNGDRHQDSHSYRDIGLLFRR